MEVVKSYKSSNELPEPNNNYRENYCRTSYNNADAVNNTKYLFDFISKKNKIKLNSCFDKKGTKKFLLEKEKAMEKIILFDEIIDKKQNTKKSHKDKNRKQKARRSKSENALFQINKKSDKKIKISSKDFKQKSSHMVISINYVDDGKENQDKAAHSPNKKRVSKFNSLNSNFSNINSNEPLNLAVNKNDSLIYSIVSEMSNYQN